MPRKEWCFGIFEYPEEGLLICARPFWDGGLCNRPPGHEGDHVALAGNRASRDEDD